MGVRIQLRNDLATNWKTKNPILAQGELGIESDSRKLKIGDGTTTWNHLIYYQFGDALGYLQNGGYTGTGQDLKDEIDAISSGTGVELQAHLINYTNPHQVTKSQVGLSNAENTSDANKPVSTAQQTALDLKVDKITGKGLSTNDYTTEEKNRLAGLTNYNDSEVRELITALTLKVNGLEERVAALETPAA